MRHIFISVLLALGAAVMAHAQDLAAVELQAERLRAQLLDLTGREEQLRQRARQLEEDMDPRSVERSVAGIGTTDARALREVASCGGQPCGAGCRAWGGESRLRRKFSSSR